EHAPGPVAAVRRGRESEEQDARVRVTEAGYGTRPVGLVAEAGDLLAGHPLAPLDEARAATALHQFGGERREGGTVGRRHGYFSRSLPSRRFVMASPMRPITVRYATWTSRTGVMYPTARERMRSTPW